MGHPLPRHLRTLRRALKHVERQRLRAVRARFPPWPLRGPSIAQLVAGGLLFASASGGVIGFADRSIVFVIAAAFFLTAFFVFIFLGLFVLLDRLRPAWLDHPYYPFATRAEACREAKDPAALRRAAIDALAAHIREREAAQGSAYRHAAARPSYVRVTLELETLQQTAFDDADDADLEARYRALADLIRRA